MAEVTSPSWEVVKVVAERMNINQRVTENVIRLLDDDNTIPFIARYRREQTGMMDVDKLREVHSLLEELRAILAKIKSVASIIEKAGKLTEDVKTLLASAQSMPEVEHLYAPFKAGSKKTLAERAKELGLEPLAMKILQEPNRANISSWVKPGTKGLTTEEEVETGAVNIMANFFSKHKDVMDLMRDLCNTFSGTLETSEASSKSKANKEEKKPQKPDKSYKYERYFSFQSSVKHLKPHQVLAINRAESEKVISVKVTFPAQVKVKYTQFCEQQWINRNSINRMQKLIRKAIDEAFSRLIQPQMIRRIRTDLTKTAEKSSVEVFASNLKRLLLQPPVRGKAVCGLDPGFRNGCKMAIISATGQILHTDVLFIVDSKSDKLKLGESEKLKQALLKHRCDIIAVGNGTACRETEMFISELMRRKLFYPLNVSYCIVNESGASIYSVSDEAKKEMPNLDVNLRSAVSIARRLQDPLAELVKIEPKHIGVGMYQHDVSGSQLQKSLGSVVEECVSFVGVDVNSGSECLLRRVAGLTASRAKSLIAWREENGPFINRAQLQLVKGIGPKSYTQCAGFVRVLPHKNSAVKSENPEESVKAEVSNEGNKRKRKAAGATKGGSKKAKLADICEPNPLDRTCIHPESYELAERVIQEAGLCKENIGEVNFVRQMKSWMISRGIEALAHKMGADVPTMQLIFDGLTQLIEHDIRAEFEKPLFRKEMMSLEDLKVGCKLSGRVGNVCHFGAFVDIGVGRDALIHRSKMPSYAMGGKKDLELGDKGRFPPLFYLVLPHRDDLLKTPSNPPHPVTLY